MYKVFVENKVIYFTDDEGNCNQLSKGVTITFFSEEITSFIVDLIFNDAKIEHINIVVKNYGAAFVNFQKYFKIIEAAGGVVKNTENKKLFIYRLDKWDLPKGKIEKGEGIRDAALREVEEECGINNLTINNALPDTFHIYKHKEKMIFKRTYWFDMSSDFEGELVPQLEENITKVEWLTDAQIEEKVLKNTYASINELLRVVI
ncbi:MAG: NUDIX hydrolase [Vicingaceae bacterium]